jgi:CBS-domain-containing membrane protein
MRIFDEKFRNDKGHYVLQCVLATVSVLAVLAVLDRLTNAAVIAALGASCFIAFTMPESDTSGPRYMVGGYVVGIAAGTLGHWLAALPLLNQLTVVQRAPHVVFGSISVGLAIFVMVITDTEHPPAASLALGIVLNEDHQWTVIGVVLLGIVALSAIKALMKPVLRNLL